MKVWISWLITGIALSLMAAFIYIGYKSIVYFYGDLNFYEPAAGEQVAGEVISPLSIYAYIFLSITVVFVALSFLKKPILFRVVAIILLVMSTVPYIWHFSRLFDQDNLSTGLCNQILKNDITRVRRLLSAGADPNRVPDRLKSTENKHSALIFAAGKGYDEMVDLLLAAGADKSYRNGANKTASEMALERGHATLSEKLKP